MRVRVGVRVRDLSAIDDLTCCRMVREGVDMQAGEELPRRCVQKHWIQCRVDHATQP